MGHYYNVEVGTALMGVYCVNYLVTMTTSLTLPSLYNNMSLA